jgi:hypothetical protein
MNTPPPVTVAIATRRAGDPQRDADLRRTNAPCVPDRSSDPHPAIEDALSAGNPLW